MIKLDLSNVYTLKAHYESTTAEEMTRKIKSIKSLHHLPSSMKQVQNGWILDINSRYFTADFSYGLAIIENLAEILAFDTPNKRDNGLV